jgi:GNAT superfamily N-acetyltransferase
MATPPSDSQSTIDTAEALPQGVKLVSLADADYLARVVDVPASESGPLFHVMFPRPDGDFSEQQREEIIRWHAEGIKEAITSGRTHLWSIQYGDGTVVGLAGWVVEGCLGEKPNSANNQAVAEPTSPRARQKSEDWLPSVLDVSAWLKVSAALKRERQRVTGHLDNVSRTFQSCTGFGIFVATNMYAAGITIMSIRPEYQRQGLGSVLMQHVCEDTDRHGRYGYVLSSPAGVRLYSMFGFEVVGKVDTPYGPITSMLRRR